MASIGSKGMEEAKRLMAEDFLGPKEVEKVFGVTLPLQIPEIPFSSEELENAKALNQFLILRIDKGSDGRPLTLQNIVEQMQPKFNTSEKGKILYNPDWYKNENFFVGVSPQFKWALVSKDIIPSSDSKNYLEQTQAIADYLTNQVFRRKAFPSEIQNAIDEFEAKKGEITLLLNNNWKEAAKKLAELKLNKLTRQTPVEALYDFVIYFQKNNTRLLEVRYTWTNAETSDGNLVRVGVFGFLGARIYALNPGRASDILGVCLSR